jgi:hypothetical protein
MVDGPVGRGLGSNGVEIRASFRQPFVGESQDRVSNLQHDAETRVLLEVLLDLEGDVEWNIGRKDDGRLQGVQGDAAASAGRSAKFRRANESSLPVEPRPQ